MLVNQAGCISSRGIVIVFQLFRESPIPGLFVPGITAGAYKIPIFIKYTFPSFYGYRIDRGTIYIL
jgi:hypothetical protein